jgi:hypothetical protein
MRHLIVFCIGWVGLCAASYGVTFSNPAPIDLFGPPTAAPYPSTIGVAGLDPVTTSVSVTLRNFTHISPDEVSVLLVSPAGAGLLLQSGAGGILSPQFDVTYTLADFGASPLPDVGIWGPGTYRPTAHNPPGPFPPPAPGAYNNPGPFGGGSATFASTFNGTNPNGPWNLFVLDQLTPARGAPVATRFAGGWTLDITAIPEPSMMLALGAAPLALRPRRR